jgi:hypothetical protein
MFVHHGEHRSPRPVRGRALFFYFHFSFTLEYLDGNENVMRRNPKKREWKVWGMKITSGKKPHLLTWCQTVSHKIIGVELIAINKQSIMIWERILSRQSVRTKKWVIDITESWEPSLSPRRKEFNPQIWQSLLLPCTTDMISRIGKKGHNYGENHDMTHFMVQISIIQ